MSLQILVSGITEENKESVCTAISDALSGKSTHCSLTLTTRRRLLTYHTFYLDVRVKSAQSAIALVESNSFLDDLDLPDGVHVFSVNVVSGNHECDVIVAVYLLILWKISIPVLSTKDFLSQKYFHDVCRFLNVKLISGQFKRRQEICFLRREKT